MSLTEDYRWRTAGVRKSNAHLSAEAGYSNYRTKVFRHSDVKTLIEKTSPKEIWAQETEIIKAYFGQRSHHSGGETIPDCSSDEVVTTGQLAGRCEPASFYLLLHHLRHLASEETWKAVLLVVTSAYFPCCLHRSWAQNSSNQFFLKKETKPE